MKKILALCLVLIAGLIIVPAMLEATQTNFFAYTTTDVTRSNQLWTNVLYDTVTVDSARTLALGGAYCNVRLWYDASDNDTIRFWTNRMWQRNGTSHLKIVMVKTDTFYLGPQRVDTLFFLCQGVSTDSTVRLRIQATK